MSSSQADYQTPQLPCQWKHSDLHMKKMQIINIYKKFCKLKVLRKFLCLLDAIPCSRDSESDVTIKGDVIVPAGRPTMRKIIYLINYTK